AARRRVAHPQLALQSDAVLGRERHGVHRQRDLSDTIRAWRPTNVESKASRSRCATPTRGPISPRSRGSASRSGTARCSSRRSGRATCSPRSRGSPARRGRCCSRAAPRIFIAALVPRGVRLAGESVDGVLLNWCTRERVAEGVAEVREGAATSGGDQYHVSVAVYIRACIHGDDANAELEAVQTAAG